MKSAGQILKHVLNGAKDRSERRLLSDLLQAGDSGLVFPNERLHHRSISISQSKSPSELAESYASLKAAFRDNHLVVVDCSRFAAEDPEFARAHLLAGANQVIISAPAKQADVTVVYGVNHDQLVPDHKLISAASCTTNNIAPPIATIHRHFTVTGGFVVTVHAATTEQPIYDAPREGTKGRSLFNIVPTTTGAAKAIGEVIPELKGKLDGFALRVPIFDGSVAVSFLVTEKKPTQAELHEALRLASANGPLAGVMRFSDTGLVLADLLRDHFDVPCVVDGEFTRSFTGLAVVTSWYDNVDGFTSNLLKLVEAVARLNVANLS